MGLKYVINQFKKGNVIVTGLRGDGKDMLFANVIARRKSIYISNLDYHCQRSPFIRLNLDRLNVKNDYSNFIENNVVAYDYPYPENCDIYISDAGVYFPSQNERELCKQFPQMPIFQALSRHIGNCNFHCNVQNLNRLWDKIREQSDIYIRCVSCRVLFGKWVFQRVIVYDKYESCLNRVEPYIHIKAPLLSHGNSRAEYLSKDELALREFKERNGLVKGQILIYKNKSQYDTRFFKKLLADGKRGGNYG